MSITYLWDKLKELKNKFVDIFKPKKKKKAQNGKNSIREKRAIGRNSATDYWKEPVALSNLDSREIRDFRLASQLLQIRGLKLRKELGH